MFRWLWYEPLEAKDVKGFVHDLHFLLIIDRVNLHLAQAARWVICKKSGVSKFLKRIFNRTGNLQEIKRCKIPKKIFNRTGNLKEIKRFKIPKQKIFTVDVVGQLARLVQIDNVGDQEVEDVVTSLTSGKFKSEFVLVNFFQFHLR